MFQKICIKSKELNHQKIDIAFLVETMLFYGNVVVLAHKEELKTLLNFFDEEYLEELIIAGRIDLRIRENILGSMIFPNGRYNIDCFSKQGEDYSNILYKAHREGVVRNSTKNFSFVDKFAELTQPFRYDNTLTGQIRNDFNNKELLEKSLPVYIKSRYPTYQLPDNVQVEIIKESVNNNGFAQMDAYSLNSNLNIDELNKIHQKIDPQNVIPFDYSGFLLSLAEAKGDMSISAHFESEIVTNDLYSKFIEIQLAQIIKKRIQSQENLDLFEEYVLDNCHSIGDAFINGLVTKKQLLNLLEKADKFREWLLGVPDDKELIGEYYKAVTKETFVDKLPSKMTRFAIFEGIGILIDALGGGGIGTIAGASIGAIDTFYLDKLIGGWKPNHFIDKHLVPLTKK
jgi:hypothetical protein